MNNKHMYTKQHENRQAFLLRHNGNSVYCMKETKVILECMRLFNYSEKMNIFLYKIN